MREQTQFVTFFGIRRESGSNLLTTSEISPWASKMQTKRTAVVLVLTFEEALMKTIPISRGANEIFVKEVTPGSKSVVAGEAATVEVQPTFTIAFTLGTRMKDLHDTIIRTVLQQTRGNRLRAAQLLHINPRTIRRRLGKKESVGSVIRAA
jgi:DNA-binding NtrC family response regulator